MSKRKDTPVTISSTTKSPLCDESADLSVISVRSEKSLRCPVSWTSGKKPKLSLLEFKTPSINERVTEWMGYHDGDVGSSSDEEKKSSILVRYDFDKTCTKTNSSTKTQNKKCSPLCSYLKKKGAKMSNKFDSSATTALSEEFEMRLVKANSNIITQNQKISKSLLHSNNSESLNGCSSHTNSPEPYKPLSPESQKKEFCSYLQLMNPADIKYISLLQNRRSTRVKNLNILMEKKQLEEQLKKKTDPKQEEIIDLTETESNASSGSLKQNIISKSLKDLHLNIQNLNFNLTTTDTATVKSVPDSNNSLSFPLPDLKHFNQIVDFELAVKNLVKARNFFKPNGKLKTKKKTKKIVNGLKQHNSPKVNQIKRTFNKNSPKFVSKEKLNSLRSKGKLKNISLERLINKNKLRRIATKKSLKKPPDKKKITPSRKPLKKEDANPKKTDVVRDSMASCEVITILSQIDDEAVDFRNFVDDISDLEKLSPEHRRILIQNRILSSKSPLPQNKHEETDNNELTKVKSFYEIYANSVEVPLNESNAVQESEQSNSDTESVVFLNCKIDYTNKGAMRIEPKKECDAESNLSAKEAVVNEASTDVSYSKNLDNNEMHQSELITSTTENNDNLNVSERSSSKTSISSNQSVIIPVMEHDYAESNHNEYNSSDDESDETSTASDVEINYEGPSEAAKVSPLHKPPELKTLHKSLTTARRKIVSNLENTWGSQSSKHKRTPNSTLSHFISISEENGSVLKAFYVDYNLIISQEYAVTFWTQSSLGNVLGAQNMWIPKGHVQRLVLNNNCIQKDSTGQIISNDNSVAFVELWTKEHKSDKREGPVADVFATIYFSQPGQQGIVKKMLHLQNINGFSDHVQYVVLKYVPKIIVSWYSLKTNSRSTYIHMYQLATDFQTVAHINEMEAIDHYVSSLHNIKGCDNLLMGCGEGKITLWNLDHGYVVATVEMNDIKPPLATLWVKCDRGYLFTLQQCDTEIRLIAINGMNNSWKKLQSYHAPSDFDRLKGVTMEHGILIAYFQKGILFWNGKNSEPVIQEIPSETDYIPSGKYVIMMINNRIIVRHALAHLIASDDS